MRLLYLNPNSTGSMTDGIVTAARQAVPGVEVLGWTNHDGPPAIQGPQDGARAVSGLLSRLPEARAAGVDAIVIACFDDTGLEQLRAEAHCPVIGIGQAAMAVAALHRGRFGIVTTLDVSVPVIETNVTAYGHRAACAGVLASGLPVLEVEAGGAAVEAQLVRTILRSRDNGAEVIVLGCAGMSRLKAPLARQSGATLLDGVQCSAHLACALA
ncbi:aspartate/glutamate racemase family protein [Pseudodonghicola flavimaris]|uniref:Aspartate/glutamate racemase family protein n=1 Tax=Pseudodonghicola flavimaris TaxID=3050036 RepID=A0ABT7F378_9RHOB|nr:aspartate/glutamate racemase family protein [Pseudodonghicola flavimaris]MDK3019066.1 aspartate/glutamate racemase family protein [Pseudodonghicola flavimaris]